MCRSEYCIVYLTKISVGNIHRRNEILLLQNLIIVLKKTLDGHLICFIIFLSSSERTDYIKEKYHNLRRKLNVCEEPLATIQVIKADE